MRAFSLCISSIVSTARRFQKLQNVVAFVKSVLPVEIQFFLNIRKYCDYYNFLTLDDWLGSIDIIVEEAKAHKEACTDLIAFYKDLIVLLQKQDHAAKPPLSTLKKCSSEPEKEAQNERSFLPSKSAANIRQQKTVTVQNGGSQIAAAAVDHTLFQSIHQQIHVAVKKEGIPIAATAMVSALLLVIEGLQHIAGFFVVTLQELETFQSKKKKTKNVADPRMYYIIMKSKVGKIIDSCKQILEISRSVRVDLEAIPTEGADHPYVGKWIEKQRVFIRDKCSNSNMFIMMTRASCKSQMDSAGW